MYEVKDISAWECRGFLKGTRDKNNVKDPINGEFYMFKYPAEYGNQKNGDIWAEKIATEIGKILRIEVQESYLAIKDNEQGILIKYSLDKKSEYLEEGATLLKAEFPDFRVNKKPFYTYDNIEFCLIKENINIEEFIDIIFFDCVIGNTDRHSENWGIIRNYNNNIKRLIAAYDNGSSLGRELNSEGDLSTMDIEKYAKNSRSCIRLEEGKNVNHYNFLTYVLKKHSSQKIKYFNKINFLTEEKINKIVNQIPDEFMSLNLKKFVIRLLLERKRSILEILL